MAAPQIILEAVDGELLVRFRPPPRTWRLPEGTTRQDLGAALQKLVEGWLAQHPVLDAAAVQAMRVALLYALLEWTARGLVIPGEYEAAPEDEDYYGVKRPEPTGSASDRSSS